MNLGFRCCAMPMIITSMPMVAMDRIKVKRIILFAKIVNRHLKAKNVFGQHQFQSFDRGLVTIKGVKTLYLPVVCSKHIASYTG